MIIYALAGKEVYQKRKAVKSCSAHQPSTFDEDTTISSKPTEIRITSEAVQGERKDAYQFHVRHSAASFHAFRKYPNMPSIFNLLANLRQRQTKAMPKGILGRTLTAAWAYVKCALLFFIALLITWVGFAHVPLYRQRNQLWRCLLPSTESTPLCMQEKSASL
jgi:hypothetical protein